MSIDVIGALYEPRILKDDLRVKLWGFHVNITPDVLEANPALQSAVKVPEAYQRVWADDDPADPTETVALRFNGENAAREALGDLWPAGPA